MLHYLYNRPFLYFEDVAVNYSWPSNRKTGPLLVLSLWGVRKKRERISSQVEKTKCSLPVRLRRLNFPSFSRSFHFEVK